MIIFDSELDLLTTFEQYFHFVQEFAEEHVSFIEFEKRYNSFFYIYALDGHESDEEEKLLLQKYASKVNFFSELSSILYGICSDEDSLKEFYIEAGRYNSDIARTKVKLLVNSYKNVFNAA